jgi:hypothetical protein
LGLIVMRRAATLLHATPGLHARFTHDDRVLLDVLRPRHPGDAPAGRWLTPCAFRVAVGRAVESVRAGKALAVLGLDSGVDPALELGAASGTLRPGGIVHLPTLTGGELAFATTAGAHLVDAMAHAERIDVRCHADALTDATLVVHTVAPPSGSPAFADALERMHTLLARSAVRELTDDLSAFLHESELTHRQPNAAPRRSVASNDSPRDEHPGALD